jgi:hypothetical protein
MAYIEELCMPYILAYIRVLAEHPTALTERNKKFNALLNKADDVKKSWDTRLPYELLPSEPAGQAASDEETDYWGRLPVREVKTGCGFSGGFGVESVRPDGLLGSILAGAVAPFSVLEAGVSSDKYGKLTFNCPHCNYENKRPMNEFIKYCQNSRTCGKDVSC